MPKSKRDPLLGPTIKQMFAVPSTKAATAAFRRKLKRKRKKRETKFKPLQEAVMGKAK